MSCYLIRVENGHKVARSITSQEEYKLIRGSYEQKANLRLAREGNDGAKRHIHHHLPGLVRHVGNDDGKLAFIWQFMQGESTIKSGG